MHKRALPVTYAEWLVRATEQQERFWSKISKGDGCWLWTAGTDKDGYGKFQITGRGPSRGKPPVQKHVRAHRLAWELTNELILPAGLVLMHSCDTPACCNPAHLTPATQKKNRADCAAKGRQQKYPLDYPRRAAELRRSGRMLREIAEDLGVAMGSVPTFIKRGERDLAGPEAAE